MNAQLKPSLYEQLLSLPEHVTGEILSPATAKKDRVVKLPVYACHGVGHVWVVDPEARTLEAFELREGLWLLIAALKDDDPVAVPPFEAVTFSLADLWA